MAYGSTYETLKQQGQAAGGFIASNSARRHYQDLAKQHAPKASQLASSFTARRSRSYGLQLSPQNNQQQPMTLKSLLTKLEKQTAHEQAKTLVAAQKNMPGLMKEFPWQKLNWEKQFIGAVAGLNTLPLNQIKMNGADFKGADLTNAQLDGAQINGAKFTDAKMGGARMSGAQAVGASFVGAEMSGVTISNANLSNANLTRATLNDVKATGVNLNDAHGSGVQMSGIFRDAALGVSFADSSIGNGDYTGANIANAQFANTKGINNLKGAVGTPKVTSSNLAEAISTDAPIPPSEKVQTQKLQPQQIAALKVDAAVAPVRPQQPTRQWAMHPGFAPSPAA